MWGKGARERHRVSVPGDDNPKPSLGDGISPRMLLAGLSEQCWPTELVFSAFPLQGQVDFVIFIFICSYLSQSLFLPVLILAITGGILLKLGAGIHP